MRLLAAHLQQCQSSLCLHLRSGVLLSCFYKASLWLRRFLWVGRKRVVFAPSSLCVWSQRPWQSRQIILLPQGFCTCTFKNSTIVKICDVMNRFLRKLFGPYSFVGSVVFLPWQFGDRRTPPQKRNMPRNSMRYYSISYL